MLAKVFAVENTKEDVTEGRITEVIQRFRLEGTLKII